MKIEPQTVQQTLQTAFECWGLPDAIRFDNGYPWANSAQPVPTSLALWLVGLGIRLIFGRPRQSTDNAVVERSHGILANWIDPRSCPDYPTLAERLVYFAQLQRADYPVCDGLSRLQTHPTLLQPREHYHRDQDEQLWDIQRVYAYLAQYRWVRTVDQNGRISLVTVDYGVGRPLAGQHVTCWIEPTTASWVIEDKRGEVVKRLPIQSLDYPTIATMRLKYR